MSKAPDTETVEIGELDFDEWNEKRWRRLG